MTTVSPLVIDTNIALDLFVFQDPATDALRQALEVATPWLATAPMREELARVLDYPQIVRRLQARGMVADQVLGAFDQRTRLQPEAAKAPCTCKDPDDQKFIDLAVAHRATLLSKDAAVLCMSKRLARLGVSVHRLWPGTTAAPC
jgi:predicted nucleic acid-binding protein